MKPKVGALDRFERDTPGYQGLYPPLGGDGGGYQSGNPGFILRAVVVLDFVFQLIVSAFVTIQS